MKKVLLNMGWERAVTERWSPFGRKTEGLPVINVPDDFVINNERRPMERGANTGYIPGGNAIYTRQLEAPEAWAGKTLLLNLDGVYMNAEVSVNQNLVAVHPYGYTPFLVDLTGEVKPGQTNDLKISAQSRVYSSRWYAGGGLYRDITLLIGEPVHLEPWDYFITTPETCEEQATVHVSMTITNAGTAEKADVTLTIKDAAGKTAAETKLQVVLTGEKTDAELDLTVENPALWSAEDPNLYTMEFCIEAEGQEADITEKTFGIRTITITHEEGMKVNGKSVKLRGGCVHHDHGMLGARSFKRNEERKIQLLKDAGYNAIRTSHNPPSEHFLDACDRIGMYVIDEAFDCWRTGKNNQDYHLYFEDWWERDLASMVLRDRNHPSIYCWSYGNEISESTGKSNGAYWSNALADCIRKIDPTRVITCGGMFLPMDKEGQVYQADGDNKGIGRLDPHDMMKHGEEDLALCEDLMRGQDVLSVNYVYFNYENYNKKLKDVIIQGTETKVFEFWQSWHKVLELPYVIGEFSWTAFDNLGEAGAGRMEWSPDHLFTENGLCGNYPWLSCNQGDLDLSGKRRPQSYWRKVVWGLDEGIHLFVNHPSKTNVPYYGMGWHFGDVKPNWTYEEEYIGQPIKLEAYADCDEVQFYVNGELKGTSKPEHMKAYCVTAYEPGTVRAVAIRNGEAVAEDVIETAGAPARIELTADREAIAADGLDLSFVKARITDAEGRTIFSDEIELSAEVTGAGVMEGFGSANPCTDENYGTGKRRVYQGEALLCVRAGQEAGEAKVVVNAAGLPQAELTILIG